MKILFINSSYYPNARGGAPKSVQTYAERLVKMGNSCDVLTLSSGGYRRELINGVLVHYFPTPNIYEYEDRENQSTVKKLLWHLLEYLPFHNAGDIKTILKEINPDVINTNIIAGFSPWLFKYIKQLEIPIVHTARDYYLLCEKSTLYKNNSKCDGLCLKCSFTLRLKKLLISQIDSFVFLTERQKQIHSGYINVSNYSVIGNPTNFYEGRIAGDDRILFGFIGRFHRTKGIEDIIEAIKMATGKISFILSGDGESNYKHELLSKFELLDIHFEYLGFTDPSEFYSRIDYLIVPSRWEEPFGRIIVEALQSGVPVICPSLPSFKELIEERDQIFYSEGDVKMLASIIDSLNKDKKHVINSEHYRKKFSLNSLSQKLLNELTNVV